MRNFVTVEFKELGIRSEELQVPIAAAIGRYGKVVIIGPVYLTVATYSMNNKRIAFVDTMLGCDVGIPMPVAVVSWPHI